ncbi:MAG: metalloregulator ArsR/SmtB family transcription factor [Rhodobacteraceae bacterium]|nr:metalloregulator ArsR/SmtB family transcription factor [Paracoccaceae bacterium]
MEINAATQAFATLGHPGRLAVFRLLMRFAPQGVRPTEMATALGLKANTLSHHLADLTASGLVSVARQGRSLYYAVDLAAAEDLIGYLALDVGRARPDLLCPIASAARHSAPGDTGLNVLFLCTANSARSIFAEAILRDLGAGRFTAHSAGTQPGPLPHPLALETLRRHGHCVSDLRAKPVSEFRTPSAPAMDFVFTVCDTAAAEDCPPWPGQPISGHWGLPDPARATGTDAAKAEVFDTTYTVLRHRIMAFVALPLKRLTRMSLQTHVDVIGMTPEEKA